MTPLFLILLIVGMLVADQIVVSIRRRRGAADMRALPYGAERARQLERMPAPSISLPGDVFLDRGHTWARLGAEGPLRVGLDDFAQRFLGRVDSVSLPEVGRKVRRGDALFHVVQGDRTATFRSPIGGVVKRINPLLEELPSLVNKSPYDEGWAVEVEARDVLGSLRPRRIARTAGDWVREELLRLRDLVVGETAPAALATLPDGGMPADGALQHVDGAAWSAFQTDFLDATQEAGH